MGSKRKPPPSIPSTDPYKDVNADASNQEQGIEMLQQLIAKRIAKLSSEPDNPIEKFLVPIVTRIIRDYVRHFRHYNTDEKDKVVEAWGLIWAYRNDGKLLWNADKPDNKEYRPHYGYEFYFNHKRFGGPGHIWLNGDVPEHYRNAQPMHEAYSGYFHDQEHVSEGVVNIRLDYAMRLWALGLSSDLLSEPYYTHNVEEYNKIVEKPPLQWDRYKQPAFGLTDSTKWQTSQSIEGYLFDELAAGLPYKDSVARRIESEARRKDAEFMSTEDIEANRMLFGD
ncbi:hypothetical protein EG329_001770 [Mollisiaceae sp. DMI_Dod_QoI]|nr:hypothetical protein EG329_001770 [Helotiales sp. DMI_Dod_QoI]